MAPGGDCTRRHPLPDPALRGRRVVGAAPALARIAAARPASGMRVTVTHPAVKAVAHAVAASPEVNVGRWRGRRVARSGVDIGLVVTFNDGRRQAAPTIEGPARLQAAEFARVVEEGAADTGWPEESTCRAPAGWWICSPSPSCEAACVSSPG